MEKKIQIDARTALVLEGGGMRGVFTCGVLDSFMDRGIRFPYVIGVSAGACNGLSYMSGQRGRARYSNIEMLEKYHYIGLKYLWTQHNIMDFDLLFHEFPEHLVPYDYEAYFNNPARYVMVTTNCLTGKAAYLSETSDRQRLMQICRASSSLPVISQMVNVDGVPMLDGYTMVSDSDAHSPAKLGREADRYIPWSAVRRFGEDIILVEEGPQLRERRRHWLFSMIR